MKIGIFGAGGFGREVLPEIRASYPNSDIVFIVDDNIIDKGIVNGHEVINLSDALREGISITIAIADSIARERVYNIIDNSKSEHISVFSKTSVIFDHVEIGHGAIICSHSVITSNVVIGKGFHCNLFSYVAHDCIIEDYVTFAPRVCCNGNVIVKKNAYIGTGAIIKQGSKKNPIIIGEGAVVGMGAVVTKSVGDGDVVVGNPAKILIK